MSKSSSLVLFSQVPINAKFRFETPHDGTVFTKVSETSAEAEGESTNRPAFVNGGVLVFRIMPKISYLEITLDNGATLLASKPHNGVSEWGLYDYADNRLYFDKLTDVITHLENL